MKMRITQTNMLRDLLYEFGIVLPQGHQMLLEALPAAMVQAREKLPSMLIESLDEQCHRIDQIETDIGSVEQRLSQQMRQTQSCETIAEIPGVGLLTSTAVIASMGSLMAFKNARQFAAWPRLVPRQTGTGGQVRQLGISKRGDSYLRTLLMHGARSIVQHTQGKNWSRLIKLLKRCPYSVAIAAVANKLASTIWLCSPRAIMAS